ncbi:MAG: alpha-glucosidase [Solirubrobacteraceae bacterium]|jgi:alpha-glucosidase|nr:alpha-glucosidase [Solirubrobacteraceae bacterium]
MPDPRTAPWWRDAVVYQVYPRSFQDSDGDGEGDLAGIARRLDHVARLGADALWLSPVYRSPFADGGYDVADYLDVDPRFGTLEDADALIAAAHDRGLALLMDIVPCHTSIEHPWFTEYPERYIWSDREGPMNNWLAAFGGSAWSRDPASGRWYLHSFYPEQPDLNWRREDVREAMAGVLRFWRDRGADGFRLDAIDRLLKDLELRDDPPASAPPLLPEHADAGTLDQRHSRNAPDIGDALAALRAGAGPDALLVGEVYLPAAGLGPYLEHLDVAFAFELLHAPWDAGAIMTAIEHALDPSGAAGRVAWVLSNHDFPRLPDRVGARNVRAAALLAFTLPGPVFIFQGDEIGMSDGPGREPPDDRAGRDRHRHPMRWEEDAPHGGFTTGEPWLPAIDVEGGAVDRQARDPDSVLALYTDLIAARRALGDGLEFLPDVEEGVIAYRRGVGHVVALNAGDSARRAPAAGPIVRATHASLGAPGGPAPGVLEPGEGFLAERS